MIELAPDNHIATLTKCNCDYVDTLEEFLTEVECGAFSEYDCDAYYACTHDSKYYYDPTIEVFYTLSDSTQNVEFDNKPEWSTHIKLSSK
jgi:hypothetical protein